MKIEHNYYYYKRITLTKDRMVELNSIVCKYCEKVFYEAELADKTTVKFESFNELIDYDNFDKRKINTLKISGYTNYTNTISITIAPTYQKENETVSCHYEAEGKDKETLFHKEIDEFFQKATEYDLSYLMCERISFAIIIINALFFLIKLLPASESDERWKVLAFIGITALFCYKALSSLIWERLFPPAIFAWGEEEIHYKKLEKTRSNLFWCVIVAGIVNFVVGYYFSKH